MPEWPYHNDGIGSNIFRSSIVTYDTKRGEDIFLSFTNILKNGPRIIRTGMAPPYMQSVDSQIPGETTTNPRRQRLGSWLILEDLRIKDIEGAQGELQKYPENRKILESYIDESAIVESHEKFFTTKYPDYEIIGLQGCGDLTMNLWNVAYVNSPLTDNMPVSVHLFEEPLGKRTYSCLVKMKARNQNESRLRIEDIQFNPYAIDPNNCVYSQKKGRPIGNEVEFAVYGKQIIRNGQIVDTGRITNEFSDLRHIFKFPNLNPRDELYSGDGNRPRFYFGTLQNENLWFGEAQLLDHPNEQRAAICGPIFLSRLYRGMGASENQVRGAAKREGYIEKTAPREPLNLGEFRFVPEDNTLIEIYLRRNSYAWSIIGLSQDNSKIICMACEGEPGKTGFNLKDMAEEARVRGQMFNGLLMDEGYDVFQIAKIGMPNHYKENIGGTALDVVVPKTTSNENPMKRTRLRAVFLFSKKKEQ